MQLLAVLQPYAGRPPALGEDLGDRSLGAVVRAVLGADRGERLDDRVDAPAGVEDAHAEVDVAHDVVERRGVVRRRPEEHQLVLQDLLHGLAVERAADVGVHVLEDVQRATLPGGLEVEEVEEAVVVAVHELVDGDRVLLAGAVEVVAQRLAAARLQPLERRDVTVQVGVHVDRAVLATERDAIAGSSRSRSRWSDTRSPSRAKKCSKTSGMRYQDGPMSKRNPSASKKLARPPSSGFFSSTVTACPSLASRAAVASPPIPPPITRARSCGRARGARRAHGRRP